MKDMFVRHEVSRPMLDLAEKRSSHFLERRIFAKYPLSWLLAFAYLQGGYDMAYALEKEQEDTENAGNDFQI